MELFKTGIDSKYEYYFLYLCKFFTSALEKGLLLEYEQKTISLGL